MANSVEKCISTDVNLLATVLLILVVSRKLHVKRRFLGQFVTGL